MRFGTFYRVAAIKDSDKPAGQQIVYKDPNFHPTTEPVSADGADYLQYVLNGQSRQGSLSGYAASTHNAADIVKVFEEDPDFKAAAKLDYRAHFEAMPNMHLVYATGNRPPQQRWTWANQNYASLKPLTLTFRTITGGHKALMKVEIKDAASENV